MKILYDNKVVGSSISVSSELTGYLFINAMNDPRLSRVARTSGTDDEYIKFNLGTATNISDVCIMGHNLSNSATVTLQANSSDSWTSPAFEQVLTVDDIIYLNFTVENYQYWRLSIQDASNTAAYLQFAYIFLGTALTMPGMETGQAIPINSTSVSSKSFSGQIYGDKRIFLKSAKITLPIIEQAEKVLIDAFFEYVDIVTPFVLLIWEDDLDVEAPIYCALTKPLEWSRVQGSGLLWSLSLEFEEVR